MKIHLVTVILDINQLPDHIVPVLLHTGTQRDHHVKKFFRCTQAIDAGYGRNHNDIFALAECRCRRKPKLVNLVIGRRILCDISIGGRDICLRLVVIVIGDKIFHCVLRKEFLHLSVKLCCQCFIVRKYQSWLIKLCDDVRHGERLTGTCDTQQSLELVAFLEAPDQFFDCLGLVSCGFVFGV